MSQETTEIMVRGYHLDMYGHVNNARYLEFLEEARWASFVESSAMKTFEEKGWAFFIVNINITYKSPATFGDILMVTVESEKQGNTSLTLRQQITNKVTGILVVEAFVTFVVFDSNKGRPIRINEEIIELLGPLANPHY